MPETLFSALQTVIDAIKSGKIRHFFLVGGCDGAKPGRNYYTEFASKVLDNADTHSGLRHRFNKLDFERSGGFQVS